MDSLFRQYVERLGGVLHSDLSNAFFATILPEAQLIYKATAHVDGESELGNGISRHIFSYLPTALEVETLEEDESSEEEEDKSSEDEDSDYEYIGDEDDDY
jgi:Ran GTPase-activating protein (RanGAP) involved in mRNA processing and transport